MKDERKTKAQLVNELVELRQQFNSFLYFLPDALIEVDILTPRLTRMNRAAYNLFGYTEQDLAEIQIPQLFAENEYERAVEVVTGYVAESQESGVEYVHSAKQELYEFLMRKKDGSVFHAETQTSFILDKDGIPIKVQTIIRDITERKRSEEALRRYTGQLEALQRVGLELAAQMDLDELLRSIVSQAIELMQGTNGGLYIYRPEQDALEWAVAIGPNVTPVGTVLRRGVGLAGKVWETGETIIVDDYRHWDGRAAAYSDHPFTAIVGVPVRWGDEFLGVLNIHTDSPRTFSAADAELLSLLATQAAIAIRNARLYEQAQQEIAERRRLEHESKERRLYLESVLISAPDAIVTLDAQHNILEWNLGAERLFGYILEEAVGRNLDTLIVGPGNDVFEEATGFTSHVLAGRSIPPTETVRYRKDGSPVDVILAGSPILLGDQVVGVVAVYTDITARVQAEAERERLLAAEHEQRELSEALAAAAVAVSSTLDFDQVLDLILEQTRRVVPSDAVNVMLIEEEQAHIVRWQGHERFGSEEFVSTAVFPVSDVPNLAQMVEHRAPVVTPDTTAAPGWVHVPVQEWIRSYAGAPICVRDQVVGFLNVDSATPGFFTPVHARRLQAFASYAAYAIENARLYEAAQQELAERVRVEEDLRSSEEYTRNLIESSLDTIISVDMERHIVAFNKAAQETFGYRAEEILGKHIDVLYADPQDGLQVHQTTIKAGRCVREVPGLRKDGQVFPSLISASALHDARGELVGVMGVSRDITERKRAEAQLQHRLEEMALLNRITTLTASAWDVAGALHEVCAEMARFLQVPQAYLALLNPQRTAAEVVADCHPPGSPGAMGVSIPVDGNPSLAYILEHKVPLAVTQAQTDPLLAAVHDIMRRQGIQSILLVPVLVEEEVIGALGFGASQRQEFKADVDLVQHIAGQIGQVLMRRRTEEALRESEELYRSLFDGVPVGIYRSTPSGEFLDVNLAMVQLLGYPDRETLLAASAVDVYLKTDDRRRWQALVEREGVVRDFETQIRRHDGTPIWVRDTGRIVRDADGSVLCYEGSLEDITARKLATQALHRYSDRLQTLHQIDQAILAAQSPDMIIQPVLRYFGQLIPCWAVGVVMFDFEADEMTAFISDTIAFESERQAGIRLPLATFRDIEEGIAELGRGEVYVVKDLVSIFPPSQMLQIVEAQKERPAIAVPLRFQEELIGLIGFGVDSLDALTPEHIAIAREVAASLAVAFRQARLLEETQARWREAETLRQAGATLAETLSLDETLDRILEQLDQVVPYDSASVQLLREGQMEIVGGRGFAEPERVIGLKFPVPDDNPNTTVVVERRPIILADAQAAHPPFSEPPHDHIHSWLGVPLIIRGQVIGILAVDSVERAYFNDQHVRLVAPFATQAAIAIENARLYEEARQHAEELSLLYQAARDTSASLEPAEVMRRLAGSVRQAAAATSVDVLVLNETGTRVTVMAQCASPQASLAESESDVGTTYDLAHHPAILEMVRTRQPGITYADDPTLDPATREMMAQFGSRSALWLPLLVSGEVRGYVLAWNSQRQYEWNDDTVRLCQALTGSAAVALENARLYEESQQRLQELVILVESGAMIASILDISELLPRIAELMANLLGVDACAISDWRKEEGVVRTLAEYRGAAPNPRDGAIYRLADYPATAQLLHEGQPFQMRVDDLTTDGKERADLEEWKMQSLLALPIVGEEGVVGLLELYDIEQPRTFSPEEIGRGQAWAKQMAPLVEMITPVEEEGEQKLGSAMRELAVQAMRDLALHWCVISRWDPAGDQVVTVAEYGDAVWSGGGGAGYSLADYPATARVLHQRQSLVVRVDDPTTDERERALLKEEGWGTMLALPMVVKQETIGLVELFDSRCRSFTSSEIELCQTIVRQAAIAIENSRLYEQARKEIVERKRVDGALRRRNRELALLNRASQSLASTLDLDEVLAIVLGEVRRLLDVTACSVWLIDSDTDELVCLQAVTPQDEMVRGWRLAPGRGICGWVARHGKSLIVPDVWADERYFRGVDEQTELGLRAILTVPLLTKGGVIGVLQVLDTEVGRFNETDLELLDPLVASAAIAIENARLYEEARQRVAELEALQRVGLQLTSTLDLSAVLNTIAESALTLMAATDCHIYLYDEASDTFTFGTALWEDGRREAAVEAPRSDGFTATVARKGHAMVINDTSRHPLYTTPEAQKWGIQAIAGFPLKRAGRVLGVFTIAFLTPHTFGENDLRVLGLLADQAASAIENARLYEETTKRLAQTEVLREMMLAAASTLNFDQVLNRTIKILERALGVEYLGFMLPEEGGEFMKSHPSILGFTPPEGGFRFPPDQCITGRVYRTGQPVIISDVREATDYAVADEKVRSELVVPVRVGDEIVAVLNLESSELDAFGEEELTFYTAVAGQLGMAMENARLYEQARRDAATKAMLLREVNHRVKNNLTAIVGLLQAERRHADTSAWGGERQNVYRVIMHDLVNRVQGLATVHSMLSASEWDPLPLNELTVQIIYSSLQMLPRDRRVSVNVSPSPIRVTSDQAHDLALVINELVTNTVKHSMQERDEACITVRIKLDEETVTLEFRDDGPGYPEEMLQSERSSVGFDLIRNIVRRNLRGDLALYNDLGAVAVIRFALLVTCD